MTKIIATAEAENKGGGYTTNMKVHQFELIADEPTELGGNNLGPSPGDYLCMALASCTVITLRMYSDRKKWKVDNIRVKVNLVKGTEMASGNNTFYCEVSLSGELDEEQKKRLLEISKACPVHRLLDKPSDTITILADF